MRISIVGTGYVGLVSGVCLAEIGHDVICIDIDQEKVDQINKGITPIYEKGLEQLLHKHIGKNLKAVTDLHSAVLETDITFIAVGTPFDGQHIDLSFIKTVSEQIGRALKDKSSYHVVVVKSTVVPGTSDEVVTTILEKESGKMAGPDFGVGMNPEFLTEGVAVDDFMHPDRIVIGGQDEKTINILAEIYHAFEQTTTLRTNNKTAEMIKYVSNSVLATMISFSNEIANLCSTVGGIDASEVMSGVHSARYFTTTLDDGQRIQAPITSFLNAGCGFGGSCLPKDVKALVSHGEQAGQPMPLLDTVIKINLEQPQRIIQIIKKHFTELKGLRIAILGLAFKPDTDDMRESPAISIINTLLKEGGVIKAYDPVAMSAARKVLPAEQISFENSLECVLSDVDVVILVTRWNQFSDVPNILKAQKSPPLLVDGRRMLNKEDILHYDGIGL